MARAETAQESARVTRGFDRMVLPFWRLLASQGFAVVMLGFLALAGLLAIFLPQVPADVQGRPAAVASWLAFQEGKFGPFTEPLYRLGFFDVFTSRWFIATLGLLAASLFAFSVSRLPQLWGSIASPQQRVPDAFFDRAANRVAFPMPAPAGGSDTASRLQATLAARRFSVRSYQDGATAYLFADRFAWAQVGNIVTHLALIIFLVGGVMSKWDGFTSRLVIAEGTTSPVFAVSHPDQMQVEVLDAVGRFDETGTPLDYRTELVIYQGGEEVARGVVTVNDPVNYNGYRFHQAAYFGEGVELVVRDAASGNALYRSVLALGEQVPAPAITIRDAAGVVLLDDVIVPTDDLSIPFEQDMILTANGTFIIVPEDGRRFWVGVIQDPRDQWFLTVLNPADVSTSINIQEGETGEAGGLQFTFQEITGLPRTVTQGIPGDNMQAEVILSEDPGGAPYLTMLGPVDGQALTLYAGASVRIGDYDYLFEGRREFAGIEVRRDPGAKFIWVASGLLLAGLVITFYVPRMRLWARVRGDDVTLAGPAERGGAFFAEAERIAKDVGVEIVEEEQRGAPDG